MNKIIQTLLLLIFASGIINGQDLIYTISGELDNEKVSLDSILVENISNSTWMTFRDLPKQQYYHIDLTQKILLGTNNVNSLDKSPGFVISQNLPGKITLSYFNNIPAEATFTVYTINGQKVFSQAKKTIHPGNSVSINIPSSGLYLLKVEDNQRAQTFKVAGSYAQSGTNIEFHEGAVIRQTIKNAQVTNTVNNFDFVIGDTIRVSVFKEPYFATSATEKITGSEDIVFKLEGMQDSIMVVTTGHLHLSEALNFNASALTVQSIEAVSPMMANGSFQVKNEIDKGEIMPLLFLKNDSVMFGYYPNTTSDNSIKLDDILLYYLRLFPDISNLGLPNAELLELLRADSNYTELLNLIVEALNTNSSPSANSRFIELLQASALNTPTTKALKSTKADIFSEFKFEFNRDGEVKWPVDPPIYATLGFEIKKGNTVVYGPYLYDPIKLMVSPSSYFSWSLDKIFKIFEGTKVPTYKFVDEGEYVISFTNGNVQGTASNDLFNKVHETNRNIFICDMFSIVAPGIGKAFLGGECGNSVIDMISIQSGFIKDLIIKESASKAKVSKALYDVGKNLIKVAKNCKDYARPEKIQFLENYMDQIAAFDVLAKAESVTKLILLGIDFYNSEIYGNETRYFYNNTSFGELQEDYVSLEFTGKPESEHQFVAKVKEKVYTYNIELSLTATKFNKEEIWKGANKVPFNAILISGDAKIVDKNPLTTSPVGSLFCTFQMGKQNSTIKIEPTFKNSGIATENITLTVDSLLEDFLIENSPWDCSNSYSHAIYTFHKGGIVEEIWDDGINFWIHNYQWGVGGEKTFWIDLDPSEDDLLIYKMSTIDKIFYAIVCEDNIYDCDDERDTFVSLKE